MSAKFDSKACSYSVVYVDGSGRALTLARELDEATAGQRARDEAKRRNVGRMFAAGSIPVAHTVLIIAE